MKKKFIPKHEIVNGKLSCGILNCPRDVLFFIAYFKAQAAAREAELKGFGTTDQKAGE